MSDEFHFTSSGDIVAVEHNGITRRIKLVNNFDPLQLPWRELGVDVVIECTGAFRDTEGAGKHITAGAKKVVISAPPKTDDIPIIVLGVNGDKVAEQIVSQNINIISNASCTTNCITPAIKVMNDHFNLQKVSGITVHAYTNSQKLQDDSTGKDFRESRAAAVNLIPASTGASKATEIVLPEVKGKLLISSIRAPVITGSMVWLSFELDRPATVEEVNEVFKSASQNQMKGIVEYSTEEIVSTDIIGNTHSCIFDSKQTEVLDNLVKICVWYDNEWGYTNRLVECVELLGQK